MKLNLSATVEDISKLSFPLYASPKLDGIRATVIDGKLYSRNMKLIPSLVLQDRFGHPKLNGLDGELIFGPATARNCFQLTTSHVMSELKGQGVRFFIFDDWACNGTFEHRQRLYMRRVKDLKDSMLIGLPQHEISSIQSLIFYEEAQVHAGYEGVMLRGPSSLYKRGRSTLRENGLMKLKRFTDAEAIVVDVVEEFQNTNEAERDHDGTIKRSNKKAGMVQKGRMGALVVEGINGEFRGTRFNVGTGFTHSQRKSLWDEPPIGQTVKYKYLEVGSKNAPRHPVFLGFRED